MVHEGRGIIDERDKVGAPSHARVPPLRYVASLLAPLPQGERQEYAHFALSCFLVTRETRTEGAQRG